MTGWHNSKRDTADPRAQFARAYPSLGSTSLRLMAAVCPRIPAGQGYAGTGREEG